MATDLIELTVLGELAEIEHPDLDDDSTLVGLAFGRLYRAEHTLMDESCYRWGGR